MLRFTSVSLSKSVGHHLSACLSISQHYICELDGVFCVAFFLHVWCFLTMPNAVRCYLSVTGWHLPEPDVKSELSVVTLDCLKTFISIYCCVLLSLTVAQCWQGCKKFIFLLLEARPEPTQTCIRCDRLSLFRLCDTDISLWMSKANFSDVVR